MLAKLPRGTVVAVLQRFRGKEQDPMMDQLARRMLIQIGLPEHAQVRSDEFVDAIKDVRGQMAITRSEIPEFSHRYELIIKHLETLDDRRAKKFAEDLRDFLAPRPSESLFSFLPSPNPAFNPS